MDNNTRTFMAIIAAGVLLLVGMAFYQAGQQRAREERAAAALQVAQSEYAAAVQDMQESLNVG